MKKDVHIYLQYDLANKIDNIAKSEKASLSDTYAKLLNQGLMLKELILNLKLTNMNFKKITSNTNYIKALLRKIYSDNNLEFSNELNQNIIDFDNAYLKKGKMLDE